MQDYSLRVKDSYQPSRFEVARIYAKRFRSWRADSWPYISGDAFSSIADVEFNPPFLRDFGNFKKNLVEADIVFVQSQMLDELFEDNYRKLKCKVVIAGNSDFEHISLGNKLPRKLKHLFLQNNLMAESDLISSIPIGIENLRFGRNGNTKLLSSDSRLTKKNKVMIGPFGKTHEIRNSIVENLMECDGPWETLEGFADIKDFVSYSRSFKYIAAPRGNGIDTHRLWETLYRGQWPIIEKHSWANFLMDLKLPIKYVPSWEAIDLESIIKHSYLDVEFDPLEIEELWMPYWKNKILSKI
jgi:hypothetical protein